MMNFIVTVGIWALVITFFVGAAVAIWHTLTG